ncbi:MAG TPA: hypothetical protein VGD80_40095 [Kofleriaceae bacterium]
MPEAGQEVVAQLDEVARQRRMHTRGNHSAVERYAHLDLAGRAPRERQDHRVRGRRAAGRHRRRLGPPVMDRIGDAIDVIDAQTCQRLDQRRQLDVLAEDHRDEDPALLDPLVDEHREFLAHPAAFAGVRREHHQGHVAAGEPVVDLDDDIVAGRDLVHVVPGVDPAFQERVDELLDRRLVERAVADKHLAGRRVGAHHVTDLSMPERSPACAPRNHALRYRARRRAPWQ